MLVDHCARSSGGFEIKYCYGPMFCHDLQCTQTSLSLPSLVNSALALPLSDSLSTLFYRNPTLIIRLMRTRSVVQPVLALWERERTERTCGGGDVIGARPAGIQRKRGMQKMRSVPVSAGGGSGKVKRCEADRRKTLCARSGWRLPISSMGGGQGKKDRMSSDNVPMVLYVFTGRPAAGLPACQTGDCGNVEREKIK